jgi:hypothetical protein
MCSGYGIQEGRRRERKLPDTMNTTPCLGERLVRQQICHISAKSASPNIRCRLLTRLACRVRVCVPMVAGMTEQLAIGSGIGGLRGCVPTGVLRQLTDAAPERLAFSVKMAACCDRPCGSQPQSDGAAPVVMLIVKGKATTWPILAGISRSLPFAQDTHQWSYR